MATILIVDDANFMRRLVKNALIPLGHEIVAEAENGSKAVASYKLFKPDLVTMDVTMKEMDGVKAAEEILKFDSDANIIMVTALGQKELLKKAIDIGVKDFIVKPFTPERLRETVKRILKNK